MVALQIFEQFCPKAGDSNPLVAEPETDFSAKRSSKVIYFGIIEEPLFSTTPLSFDAPSPTNPREYPHKTYLARN